MLEAYIILLTKVTPINLINDLKKHAKQKDEQVNM